MRAILHILTRPADELTQEIIRRQQASGENKVAVADLTKENSDYKELLQSIFAVDNVEVW